MSNSFFNTSKARTLSGFLLIVLAVMLALVLVAAIGRVEQAPAPIRIENPALRRRPRR